jgi:hypothetical protein
MRLIILEAGAEALAEGRLEPVHGGLGQGTTTVMHSTLPVRQAEEPDFLDTATNTDCACGT